MASKPRSQIRRNNSRMLLRMFHGSKPIAASTMPTRIDSRTSRNATARGEPPRKRESPSLSRAGKSLTSLGIGRLLRSGPIIGQSEADGTRSLSSLGCGNDFGGNFLLALQHSLQRLQPVGFARRLVPAQPVDAGKAHRDAGFVPRRALQALERHFQHQSLIRLVDDMADRPEF